MKKSKTKKIRSFHKKSVLPSIILFSVFIVFCMLLIEAIIGVFGQYLMDSKILNIKENAEHLGGMITARMEREDVFDAVAYVNGYLKKENSIVVTNEEHKVLMQSGKTCPDFRREETIELFDVYTIMPDVGADKAEWENGLMLPFAEIWERTVKTPPQDNPEQEQQWLKENIFSMSCWIEIPVKLDGYHMYYRDSVTVIRRDILYMLVVGVIALIALAVPNILLFINVLSSISMQKRMVKLLYLDTTTGGKNWLYFVDRSKKILRGIWNSRNTYAIVNLHIDRFQDYCACYGGPAGEEMLENIDGFLQAKTGRRETFARYEGADFGLLLRCDDVEQCGKRLRKLLAELTGIKRDRKLSCHMGVCIIPPAANEKGSYLKQRRQIDVDQLYHYANAARMTLPEREGELIRVFDHQILEEQLWKHKVEDTMESALMNKEFQIYLQPKYNPMSGKLVGAEALVRWLSPTEGLITPSRFIPIFEENGFITRLDDYMISGVAKLQSEWKLQGRKAIPVSVNVSRANFTKEDLARHICYLVDGYGAEHSGIELEVTESAFFGNKDVLQKVIRELKMYGFRISMDDFGAGYSSLNSLKDLPVDVLKLDMEFFKGEDREGRGEVVVKETIQLAKSLEMKIVAEGIERKEQVDFLAEQGCDMIQGYYYAKPMTIQEFDERAEQDG